MVFCYFFIVYYAGKNCYDFLYKQRKFKNLCLTAFYCMCITTCICRIVQYTFLVIFYFITNEQNTDLFLLCDMISNTFMMSVGVVMVLQNVQLTQGVQLLLKHRRDKPHMARNLGVSLCLVLLIPLAFEIFAFKLTYYAVSLVDLVIAVGLFVSLRQTINAIEEMQYLQPQLFEGCNMLKYFVRMFGLSFITASGINFCKSFYIDKYSNVLQTKPYASVSLILVSNVLDQMMPFVLMLVMHRRNFTEPSDEDAEAAQLDETLVSEA